MLPAEANPRAWHGYAAFQLVFDHCFLDQCNAKRYTRQVSFFPSLMIISFHHKGLKRFFETGDQRGIPSQFAARIRRQLDVIDAATMIEDIDLPGYDLHELKGKRKGTWSIKVSGNWRITFQFRDGDAFALDLEDYH